MTAPERDAPPPSPRDECPGIPITAGGMPAELGSRIGFILADLLTCPTCGKVFTRWVLEANWLKHKVPTIPRTSD